MSQSMRVISGHWAPRASWSRLSAHTALDGPRGRCAASRRRIALPHRLEQGDSSCWRSRRERRSRASRSMTTWRSARRSPTPTSRWGWDRSAQRVELGEQATEVDGEELVTLVGEDQELEKAEARATRRRARTPAACSSSSGCSAYKRPQRGMCFAEFRLHRGVQRPAQLDGGRGAAPSPGARATAAGSSREGIASLTIYVYIRRMQGQGGRWPASGPSVPRESHFFRSQQMHPWTMQRLAARATATSSSGPAARGPGVERGAACGPGESEPGHQPQGHPVSR